MTKANEMNARQESKDEKKVIREVHKLPASPPASKICTGITKDADPMEKTAKASPWMTKDDTTASTNLLSPDEEALLRGAYDQQHPDNQRYPSHVHGNDGEDTCVSSVTTHLGDMPRGIQLYPSIEEAEEQGAEGGGGGGGQLKVEPPAVSPSQKETTLQSMEDSLLVTKENERKTRQESKEKEKHKDLLACGTPNERKVGRDAKEWESSKDDWKKPSLSKPAPDKEATMEPSDAPSTGNAAAAVGWDSLSRSYEDDVQPFPTTSPSVTRVEITPGAHRVVGPFANLRPPLRPSMDIEPANDAVVEEAVLVDPSEVFTEEEKDVEMNGSSTHNMYADVSMGELFEGKALPVEEPPNTSHWWGVPVSVLLVAGLVVTILLVVFLPGGEDKSDPTLMPSVNNSVLEANPIQYPPFQEGLPPFLLKDMEETSSPLYLANIWMWNDPNLDTYSVQRQQQRFYLASLYYATDGDSWFRNDHWLSYNISECQWFSSHSSDEYTMPVCDQEDNVISVSLASNNLSGTLPQHHPLLPMVHTLDFADNHLQGTIPNFQSSAHLEVFILSNNELVGGLVGQGAFALDRLRVAKVNGNHLEGNYASAVLPLLTALEVLDTSDNLFGGNVASEIGLCPNLTHYLTGKNLVTGILPSELSLLTNLAEISVAGSYNMTGTIPAELGQLSKLTLLDVSGTLMTGPVPESICAHVDEGRLDVFANCSRIQCCP